LLGSGVSKSTQAYLISDQLVHIERALLAATSGDDQPTWLIVCGHYPVFSVGSHGDTDELLVNLLPLLQQYKVDAYLSGHDHLSAHLE
jgi:tartrate-resistant acid phosphatase type 5